MHGLLTSTKAVTHAGEPNAWWADGKVALMALKPGAVEAVRGTSDSVAARGLPGASCSGKSGTLLAATEETPQVGFCFAGWVFRDSLGGAGGGGQPGTP